MHYGPQGQGDDLAPGECYFADSRTRPIFYVLRTSKILISPVLS